MTFSTLARESRERALPSLVGTRTESSPASSSSLGSRRAAARRLPWRAPPAGNRGRC